MLIAACMKTASTSLMITLAKILKLEYVQETHFIDKEKIGQYPSCQFIPAKDMIRVSRARLKSWSENSNKVFKQHLVANRYHLKILKELDCKVVVLIRNYEDIVSSLKRAKIPISNEEKCLEQMESFVKNYKKYFVGDNFLVIKFGEFVKNPTFYINEILNFWGFSELCSEKHRLEKHRLSNDRNNELNGVKMMPEREV